MLKLLFHVKPNSYYVATLHREGFCDGESIQIACIYYFDKSKCLNDKHGDIFQIVAAEEIKAHSSESFEKFNLNIKKDDCLVFNNTIMNHKVFKLSNNSDKTGHRSLISFWLPNIKLIHHMKSMCYTNINIVNIIF